MFDPDISLDRLIHLVRLQRDVVAYRSVPPTASEAELAYLAGSPVLDDTDWESLYAWTKSADQD
jgi:hypothetical protein